MAVTTDILQSWRRPRRVIRRLLDQGRREDRALIFLMVACLMIFVGQLPRLQREAVLNAEAPPLEAQLAITFFAMMMIWPILLYGLGGLSHLLARLFGGKGSWYSARLALFWSLLVTTPAWMFFGLVTGMIGPGPAQTLAGVGVLLAFLTIWGMTLFEAETAPERQG